MDYMEAVKELEEKLVSNQKPDHEGMVDIKCNGEVVHLIIIMCYNMLSRKQVLELIVGLLRALRHLT